MNNFFIQRSAVMAILLAGVTWLSSCQKGAELFVPDPGQPNGADTNWVSSINGIMPITILRDSLLLQPQTDSLNASKSDSIVTSAGVQLRLYPNSLEQIGGGAVEGKVKLEFMALQKRGDLIRMNIPTVTDSAVLSTAATFYIRFTQDGNELQVKRNLPVQLSMPGEAMGAVSKFYIGQQGQEGIYNWKINADSFSNVILTGNNPYLAAATTLGWISAGYTLPAAANRLQLSLPLQYTNANSAAYVILNNHRSVIRMTGNATEKKFVCNIIPVDHAATVVVVSKQGNDYFAGTQQFSLATGSKVVDVLPVKTSLEGLKQLLGGL